MMQIYKTTCLKNNKIYIGQNINDDPNYLGSGSLLKKAIIKYGKENFKKEILCECSSLNELNEKEIYWINFYNSTNKKIGYNITKGGNGQLGVKGKNNKLFGRKRPSHAKLMSQKIRGENNPMYGKKGELSPRWQEPSEKELKIIKNMIGNYKSLHKICVKLKRKKHVVLRWMKTYLPEIFIMYSKQNIDLTSEKNLQLILQIRNEKPSKFSKTPYNGVVTIAKKINKIFNLKGDYKISYKTILNILKKQQK